VAALGVRVGEKVVERVEHLDRVAVRGAPARKSLTVADVMQLAEGDAEPSDYYIAPDKREQWAKLLGAELLDQFPPLAEQGAYRLVSAACGARNA
jgi:hypothetical protein